MQLPWKGYRYSSEKNIESVLQLAYLHLFLELPLKDRQYKSL